MNNNNKMISDLLKIPSTPSCCSRDVDRLPINHCTYPMRRSFDVLSQYHDELSLMMRLPRFLAPLVSEKIPPPVARCWLLSTVYRTVALASRSKGHWSCCDTRKGNKWNE